MSRKSTTVFVNSLRDLDLSEIKMPMAVIYDSPKDFPDMYLCRIWEGAGCHPTTATMQKNSLDEMREDIAAAGFTVKIPRSPNDDPVILETWMK